MSRNKEKKGGRGKQRGRERSNSARNSNKSTTIPIEKLRFTIGDNQAENYARLIEYLAEQVLEEYGRKKNMFLKLNGIMSSSRNISFSFGVESYFSQTAN